MRFHCSKNVRDIKIDWEWGIISKQWEKEHIHVHAHATIQMHVLVSVCDTWWQLKYFRSSALTEKKRVQIWISFSQVCSFVSPFFSSEQYFSDCIFHGKQSRMIVRQKINTYINSKKIINIVPIRKCIVYIIHEIKAAFILPLYRFHMFHCLFH